MATREPSIPPASAELEAQRVGLCVGCRHGRRVVSAKGSTFWLCERSNTEPDVFAKYPALPVRRCPGFEAAATTGTS